MIGLGVCLLLQSTAGHVVRVSQELAALSVTLGKPVTSSKELGPLCLFIEPGSASPADQLSLVAACLGASIHTSDQGLELVRTKQDRVSAEVDRTKLRQSWLEASIKEVEEYRNRHTGGGNPLQELRREMDATDTAMSHVTPKTTGLPHPAQLLPAQGLLLETLKRIGLDRIAGLSTGEAMVFEDQPVADAEPLPECGDLKSLYEKQMLDFGEIDGASREKYQLQRTGVLRYMTEAGNYEVAKLRVKCQAYTANINVVLEGFDRSGTRTAHAAFMASPLGSNGHFFPAGGPRRPDVVKRPSDLLPEELKAAEFPRVKAGLPLPAWIIDPVKNEPLEPAARAAIQGVADETPGAPFAALVSEDLFLIARGARVRNSIDMDKLESDLDSDAPYQKLETKAGVAWRPIDLDYICACTADRKALKTFTGRFQKEGHTEIRPVTQMYSQACDLTSPLADYFRTAPQLNTGELPVMDGDSTGDLLRALGDISDEDWARLCSGQTLTCGNLGITDAVQLFFRREDPSAKGEGLTDLTRHATELLSRTVPAEMPVSFSLSNPPMVEATLNNGSPERYWVPVLSLASDFPVKDGYVAINDGKPIIMIDQATFEQSISGSFRLGARSELRVRFGLGGGHWVEATLQGAINPTSQPIAYADLGDEIRAEIFQEYCRRTLAQWANVIGIATGQIKGTQVGSDSKPIPPP